MSSNSPRQRVREVLPGLHLGFYPPGPLNSLTDVPGVLVSTISINRPAGHNPERPASVINTGLTTILPRRNWFDWSCYAAVFSFNGSGEMTGTHWINETGLLSSPIVITNSFAVGAGYEGICRYAAREYGDKQTGLVDFFLLPLVAETYDGFMNDIAAGTIKPEMVTQGIEAATADRVPEGNTGGGTGMLTMGFKAGTGSASRVVPGIVRGEKRKFTVAALVQSNFGKMNDLHFGSVPVGRIFAEQDRKKKEQEQEAQKEGKEVPERKKDGSIIVILATDAPLHPTQLGRLVKRATVGLSRAGGFGSNSSGDIFLAFSTASEVPREPPVDANVTVAEARFAANVNQSVDVVQDATINGLFEAAAEVVHESILNALCMAQDMEGPLGMKANAIDLERLKNIVNEYSYER